MHSNDPPFPCKKLVYNHTYKHPLAHLYTRPLRALKMVGLVGSSPGSSQSRPAAALCEGDSGSALDGELLARGCSRRARILRGVLLLHCGGRGWAGGWAGALEPALKVPP